MTTGDITTGFYTHLSHIHFAKSWLGDDGHTMVGQYGPVQKWNSYRMGMCKFRAGNPNVIGLTHPTTGVYVGNADNHSWNKTGGDPETIGYSPAFGYAASAAFPIGSFNLIFTEREELELLSKLLAKVKGHSFNMGVALAEVDKLAGTVLGTLKDIGKGAQYLARGRFDQFARLFGVGPPSRKARRRLQATDVSGRFLEMRYAWEPALNDVYEASKAFEQISNGPRTTRTHKGQRVVLNKTYWTNYCKVPQVITAKRSYIFEMYEEMSVARQMGLGNPASILWERIPYSFVVDWFIPIGTYLELIGQIPFMTGRWLRTDSIKYESSGTFQADKSVGGWGPHTPLVDGAWEVFNLRRTVLSGPPDVPRPTLVVHGAVHGKRIANAIALTHQLLSKLGPVKAVSEFAGILVDPQYLYTAEQLGLGPE